MWPVTSLISSCSGFVWESQHIGGIKSFQTPWVDQSVKDVYEPPTFFVYIAPGGTLKLKCSIEGLGGKQKMALTFSCAFCFQSELHGHISDVPGGDVVRWSVSQPR